jgi:hypothetical protein
MPDQPEKKVVRLAGAAKATSRSSGTLRVRLIQHSPLADLKLVEEVRQFERELKEKESHKGVTEAPVDSSLDDPLILLVDK